MIQRSLIPTIGLSTPFNVVYSVVQWKVHLLPSWNLLLILCRKGVGILVKSTASGMCWISCVVNGTRFRNCR